MRRLFSRRDLLLSGGALGVSAIASGFGWNRAVSRAPEYDVVVVGAGAAGVAAARTIQAAGASVLLLEATHRVGGRIAGGVLSGVARGNCDLHALVARAGVSAIPAAQLRTRTDRRNGAGFDATYAAMFSALMDEGERIHDGFARDRGVDAAVRPFRKHPAFADARVRLGIHNDRGRPASVLDYYLVANRAASPFDFPADDTLVVPSGLDGVLADAATDLSIVRGARVASIAYREGNAILRTESGDAYRAHAAIVTASTDVLASGSIAFEPPLPATTASAVAALPLRGPSNASSYATVGNASARTALAAPLARTLWFAGEATAQPGFGCVEGAWESGAAAARAALTA
jgi:monoamine oxidase